MKQQVNQNQIIDKTRAFIMEKLAPDPTGHDFHHAFRVARTALHIASAEENPDLFIIELAALLHDIADWKFHDGDEDLGVKLAYNWLRNAGASESDSEKTAAIIKKISFKGAFVNSVPESLEGKIVQDADRLDALGAIGIARAFSYGGFKRNLMYDPDLPPVLHHDAESYKNSRSTTVNHFHEKMLLLKDRMNTAEGRRLAEERHRFLELYLTQFHREWNGENS